MLLSLSFCFAVISSLLLIYSQYLCSFNVGKERRGWFVKWVEKALFTHLNKLFEINTVERAHNVFLLDKNLQALIENPEPFIISVFPRLAPLSLEPDEHFVLKDFPFYEVNRLANSEVRQACLEEWEKKCQEGTLRQALTTSHLTSNSVVCHLTQKKKLAACLIQKARTPLPATLSSSSTSSPSSSSSSSFSSDEVEARVDRLVPLIICEEKEEKEMTSNLRARFREK